MSDFIVSDDRLEGHLGANDFFHFIVDGISLFVCQEYWTDIGTLDVIQLGSILFFFAERLFMLFYLVLLVIFY